MYSSTFIYTGGYRDAKVNTGCKERSVRRAVVVSGRNMEAHRQRASRAAEHGESTARAQKGAHSCYHQRTAKVLSYRTISSSQQLHLCVIACEMFACIQCHNIEVSLYGVNHRKSKDTQRTLDILMA